MKRLCTTLHDYYLPILQQYIIDNNLSSTSAALRRLISDGLFYWQARRQHTSRNLLVIVDSWQVLGGSRVTVPLTGVDQSSDRVDITLVFDSEDALQLARMLYRAAVKARRLSEVK